MFKNSLIIHKEKTKEILCLISVFISDKDTAKLYVNDITSQLTNHVITRVKYY